MNIMKKINEYLDETIITKRKQSKKIEKLQTELKIAEEKIKNLNERVSKWTNTSRELNKELEDLKYKYTQLFIETKDTMTKLERKNKRLENKIKKGE